MTKLIVAFGNFVNVTYNDIWPISPHVYKGCPSRHRYRSDLILYLHLPTVHAQICKLVTLDV